MLRLRPYELVMAFLSGLAVVFAAAAFGQENNYGASYLGFCSKHWPCAQSLKVFEGLPEKRVRWLAVTFGKECPCVEKFLRLPGKKLVSPHLANGTCFPERGRICGKDEPFYRESIASADRKVRAKNAGLLRKYRKNARNVKGLLKGIDADTEVIPSICLECPLSDRARVVLLTEAVKIFPGVQFSDSVLTQKCLPGLLCEKHGRLPRLSAPCIADTDGDDFQQISSEDYRERTSSCRVAFLWGFPFNLIDLLAGRFQPPTERTRRPVQADFEALRSWLND